MKISTINLVVEDYESLRGLNFEDTKNSGMLIMI